MYGGFIVPGDDDRAHFGVLFWHKDGFSTACGHGIIALGCWAIAKGIVKPSKNGVVDVVVDVPSGRVVAQIASREGEILHVDFVNVSSYQIAKGVPVDLGFAQLKVDLSFGGAVFASVDVNDLGEDVHVESGNYERFISLGRQIKALLGPTTRHGDYDLASVCFFETEQDTGEAIVQKNVVVFADGQIDRSPCGSGTAARMAVLLAQGRINSSKKLIHRSIIGTEFEAFIDSYGTSHTAFPACVPRVRGMASLTGRHSFYIDPKDYIYPGFLFR